MGDWDRQIGSFATRIVLNTVAPPCRCIHPSTVAPYHRRPTAASTNHADRRTHTHTHAHARARARARSVDPASAARDGYSLPAPRGRERPVGQFSTQDRTLVACVPCTLGRYVSRSVTYHFMFTISRVFNINSCTIHVCYSTRPNNGLCNGT